MTEFDHRDPGTAAADWDAPIATLPHLTLPPPQFRLVVAAAHPDDETLGVGGLIAAAAARGIDVTVVIATDGAASHPGSPTHSPSRLAQIRADEAERAVAGLGAKLIRLELPDGELAAYVDELAATLRSHLDGDCWLLAPWRGDRHPDHEACALAAERAATGLPGTRRWEYPIWAWHWGSGTLPFAQAAQFGLDDMFAQAKQHALHCYPSQFLPLSADPADSAVVTPEFLAHFARPVEVLIDPVPRPAGATGYFDALYAEVGDPWGLESRWYEQRKRSVFLASLPRRRFSSVFEPGCGPGLLTAELVERSDFVLAVDGSAAAVGSARARVGGRAEVSQMRIPEQWPQRSFELIALYEVGYYCADLVLLVQRIRESLTEDGILVACHWRRPAPDHPHTGDEVHAALRERLGLASLAHHLEDDFVLDVFARDPRSVADRDGVIEP